MCENINVSIKIAILVVTPIITNIELVPIIIPA